MNLSSIRNAAIAALILGTAAAAHAERTYNDAVIFGNVTLRGAMDSEEAYLSVTIPTTDGAFDIDGRPTTIWNLGTVMASGVYDSFYHGGPGYFRVENTGNYPAYVYVSTGTYFTPRFNGSDDRSSGYSYSEVAMRLFDPYGLVDYREMEPVAAPKFLSCEWGQDGYVYALAVSTDVTALVPMWRPLSWFWVEDYDGYNSIGKMVDGSTARSFDGEEYCFTVEGCVWRSSDLMAYLAHMPVGETQLFDLKFWAPPNNWHDQSELLNRWFIIRIEASAVKLWDHDQ